MRQKGQVKKVRKEPVPKWVFAASGYALLSLLLLYHLALWALRMWELSPIFPRYSPSPWQELLLLSGGPAALLFGLALSFRSRKLCGAVLLLGAALVSGGIAFQSGYFLKTYLLRMLLLGVPQVVAGVMFLKSDGKTRKK